MENTTVIIAIITVLGQIFLLFLQRGLSKTQAQKTENEASGILIDKALNINKQETENLKLLLEVIKKEYQDSLVDIKRLKYELDCVERKYAKA